MSDDIAFNRSARRPAVPTAVDRLQWSIGLPTTKREIYVGWFVEVGRNDRLDDAMTAAGFDRIDIKHGSGDVVTHWRVETANVFVVADGVPSRIEMKDADTRWGAAYWWHDGKSFFAVHVLLRELLAVGYTDPLLMQIKGTQTDDVLAGMQRQYDVLNAIDALREEQGKAALNPPFYACSIAFGPGQELSRGKGQNTKQIVPPVALIPDVITREYLVEHYIRKDWLPAIEPRIDAMITWSVQRSATGGDGTTGDVGPVTLASQSQLQSISPLVHRLGWTADDLLDYADKQYGIYSLNEMTIDQAAALIDGLKRLESPPAKPQGTQTNAATAMSVHDAKRRFYSKYGIAIAEWARTTPADVLWSDVLDYLEWPNDEVEPRTVDGWFRVGRAANTRVQELSEVAA